MVKVEYVNIAQLLKICNDKFVILVQIAANLFLVISIDISCSRKSMPDEALLAGMGFTYQDR